MRYLLILLILIFSFPSKTLKATHALGGDLNYEQIGPNEYFVTLRIYRDCNGIDLSNTEDIDYSSDCTSGSFIVTRVSELDITPLCPGAPTACNGGSGSIGIEEHIYTATVTLPPACTDVNFNYTLCCRNHVITTLTDPGNENIFLYATHENTAIVNHSPIFNNYPSPIVCVNQPVLYNHGVSDPDGDSLYFSASNCYEAFNDTVEYLGSYNGVTALTTVNPIDIDPNTGAISFTPNIQQVGVMCILVEEFRNGVKVGETIRDIQFNVIACANVPPVASGINNLPGADSLDFVFNICESNVVCFDLSFSDPDIDVLNVSWNGEISGATFQVSSNNTIAPTAQFCWSPQPGDVGLNYFSVNIVDDACPLVGSSTYTYTVDVLPNPNSLSLTYNDLACEADSQEIIVSPSSVMDSSYWVPNSSLLALANGNASVFPSTPQTFVLQGFFPDGCYVEEQAPINIQTVIPIQASANTSNICNGGTVTLNGSGGQNYTWSDSIIDNVPFTPSPGIHTFFLAGEDINGCPSTDSVSIQVNPVVNIVANPDTIVCDGDSVVLNGQGALTYTWNNGIQNGMAFQPSLGSDYYVMTATDVNGCVATDSIVVTANPLPNIQALSSGINICKGDSLLLTATGADNPVWNNGVQDSVVFVPVVGSYSYVVSGNNSFGCFNKDSITVNVHDLPNITVQASDDTLCIGNSVNVYAVGAQNYYWSNGVVQNVPFTPSLGLSTYHVDAVDNNGCTAQDSVQIMVHDLPDVNINLLDSVLCDGDSLNLSASGAQSYAWSNNVQDGVSFVPAVGNITYTVIGTDTNNCQNQEAVQVTVNPNPNIVIQASNNGNSLCDGDSAVLTAYGAQNYTWNNGVVNGQSFQPPVGTTPYIVSAENLFGCFVEDSLSIVVNPLPVVDAQATANNVCFGDSIQLICAGTVQHFWDNGVVDGVDFMPPLGLTNYKLNVIDSNLCENKDSVDVLVYPLPELLVNADDSAVCEGQTVALFASGAQNYAWSNGLSNGMVFTPPVGLNLYTVTGVDTNGCMNEATISIQAHELPAVSPYGGDTAICYGETITLTGSGANYYSWNNGVVNGESFVPYVGVHNYVVTGIDTNACVSSDSVEVEVYQLPNVLALSSDDSVCLGESIALNGSGALSYTWSNGLMDGDTITPLLGENVYTVLGVDTNQCENTATISVHAIPLGNIAPLEDLVVCDIEELEVSTTGSNIDGYQWGGLTAISGFELEDGPMYQGTQTNELSLFNLQATTNASYYVEAYGVCGNVVSDTFSIAIHESPNVDVLGDTSLCIHENNLIFADLEGFNFEWNDGTPGQVLNPSYSGMYYISFEEYGTTCIISDTLFVEMEDCIDQCVVLAPTGFSPNSDGANDGFRVVSTCDEGFTHFNLMIYNRWGEKVFQTDDPNYAWDGMYKGTSAPLSTYAYMVEYTKEFSSEKEMLKGNVTLIK